MNIYYVISSIVVLCLLILSIIIFINLLKCRKEIDIKNKEINSLNSKIKLLGKQLIIQNATLQTCKGNVESLRTENITLKNKVINNQKKINTINNFISEIKKT
jgi:uncharacterized protein YoxC